MNKVQLENKSLKNLRFMLKMFQFNKKYLINKKLILVIFR